MEKLLLIKLGGSIITDKSKPYTAKVEHVRSLARILKGVGTPLVIAHGSGSYGHTSAAKYGGSHGFTDRWGIAKVSFDALTINHIVMQVLVEEKISAVSFRPSSMISSQDGELAAELFTPLKTALSLGLTPVVYGDVIWDKTWKSTIFSGETTLKYLAHHFLRSGNSDVEIIELCDTDGVLDADGKTIAEITPKTWPAIQSQVLSGGSVDVTGGMRHKVEEGLELTKMGVSTRIINGKDLNDVEEVLIRNGTKGTLIHA